MRRRSSVCGHHPRASSPRKGTSNGLQRGAIDTIGSDHSPCPLAMKHLDSGDFMSAWGGIASLQLTLPCPTADGVTFRLRGLLILVANLGELVPAPECLLEATHRSRRRSSGPDRRRRGGCGCRASGLRLGCC